MNGKRSTDINLSIENGSIPPTIPEQIQRAGFRFIRIRPKSKIPNDKDWQRTKNFSATDRALLSWINTYQSFEIRSGDDIYTHFEGYGNYGVLCSADAVVVDLDTPELVSFLLETMQTDSGAPRLPATLLCKSGSGRGIHAYFRTSKGHPVRLLDPENPDTNVGDIKSVGGQVVGPNALHPGGKPYEIIQDREIAFVEFSVLKEVFSKWIPKQKEISPESIRREYGEYEQLSVDVPIAQVLYPDKAVSLGNGEFRGAHPIHGSSGGRNFSINTNKNTWFCSRHNTGGGPLEAIALLEGIIECGEAGPGCLRGEKFLQTIDAAKRMGFTVKLPQKKYPKKPEVMNTPPKNAGGEEWTVLQLEEIPADLPGTAVTILNAPPRLGKSHWAILKAIEAKTANVITNTHSIVEQHLRIFRENRSDDQTAIHMEGKARSCVNKDDPCHCKKCPYYPYETKDSFFVFGQVVMDYLFEKKVLTNKDVPDDQCPYWFVKRADDYADYCFTVVANMDMLRNRHLLVIDEDPTISHFYPASVDVAESVYRANRLTVSNFLEEKWVGIENWKKYIVEKKKRPKGRRTILRIISILEDIRDIIKIDDERQFSRKYVLDKLKELNLTIDDPEDCTKQELIDLIKRHEIPDTLSPFALALLYPYKDKPFAWQGHNPSTLRIIADEEKRMYTIPDCKTLIIGSTRAELFAKSLGRSCTILNIDKFHYSGQFIVVAINDDGKKSYSQNLDNYLKSISRMNEYERYPCLVLVGTEREQQRLQTILGGIAKSSTGENRVGQTWNYRGGYLNIFYQNSVISRGIDVEFYHRLFVYSSNFANPYWQAALDVAAENDDQEEVERVGWVIDAITVDETTNSVLRISPVRRNLDMDPRLVVIGESDMWKLKPAITDGAHIVHTSMQELMENSMDLLNGTGRLVYKGSEKLDYDEEAEEETIKSTLHQVTTSPKFIKSGNAEAKCEFFVGTLRKQDEGTPDWRRNIHPKVIEKIKGEITKRLVTLTESKKRSTRKALQKFLLSRNKNFKYVLTDHIITEMYKEGRIRVSGIGMSACVGLPPSSKVANESDWWDLEES